MRDKTKSYKFTGGKFVERTAEEVARLEQLWAKQAHKTKLAGRMLRSEGRFVKLTLLQLEKLFGLRSQACTLLFLAMLHENFRHRGKTFILPTDKIATLGGFSRRTQHRALLRMEACGLISVKRMPPKPPEIAIL
jgi:hypothetical protein